MVDAILPPPAVEVPLLAEPHALSVPPPHGLEVHGHTAGGQLHSHRPHSQHPPNPQAVLVLYLVLVRSMRWHASCVLFDQRAQCSHRNARCPARHSRHIGILGGI